MDSVKTATVAVLSVGLRSFPPESFYLDTLTFDNRMQGVK